MSTFIRRGVNFFFRTRSILKKVLYNKTDAVVGGISQARNYAKAANFEATVDEGIARKSYYPTLATFETNPYKLHKLQEGPSTKVSMTREEGLEFYKYMVTIRKMENQAERLFKSGAITGLCHLYSGQEACCVGMEAAVTKDDAIITSYRAHGWAYMRGISVLGILAELTGRVSGCHRGKGGSMYLYAPNSNFYGGVGIVGAQVPLGAGIALAIKYEQKPNICIALYGDGAANQGQLFETFNIAKLWALPCIFVCENNGYALATSNRRAAASADYYTRGDYISGIWVDGMDVLAVKEATRFAKDYVLNHGPIIMDLATYRYNGHSLRDPGDSYRSLDEVQEVRDKRDPIRILRNKLVDSGLATSDELTVIKNVIKQYVAEAANKAEEDADVPAQELYNAPIADPPDDMTIRGCDISLQETTTAYTPSVVPEVPKQELYNALTADRPNDMGLRSDISLQKEQQHKLAMSFMTLKDFLFGRLLKL